MLHIIDTTHTIQIGFIELLNDLSMNIVHIDNTFYVFVEFIPVDEHNSEIVLVGKNVTSIIENTTLTTGVSELKKRELISNMEVMKNRRRVFAPGTKYIKYIYGQ
jgi:uncharacterized protein YpmB